MPKKVPSQVLNTLVSKNECRENDRIFIFKHYKEDKNAIPSEYILNEGICDKSYNSLLNILRQLSKNDIVASKYFVYSATHQEIVEGILSDQNLVDNDHYFSAFRTIENLFNTKQDENLLKKYTDTIISENGQTIIDKEASLLLEGLKYEINNNLINKEDQIIRYTASLDNDGNVKLDKELELFCIRIESWLKKVIDKELNRLMKIDPLTQEVASHKLFLNNRVKEFFGRKDLLDYFESNIIKNDTVCLSGEGGSGKSTAMAKFISETISTQATKKQLIIYRFIGATPDSVNVDTLLKSIILQLQSYLNISTEVIGDIYDLTERLNEILEKATSQYNVLIFLDALDQLEDNNEAWTLSWLPKAVNNLKLIVSVVSKTPLCTNFKRTVKQKGYINNNIVELSEYQSNEYELSNMIDHLLELRSRRVIAEQKEIILNNCRKSSNSMLFIKLTTIIASKWRSFDSQSALIEKKMDIKDSTSKLIHNYFDYLSAEENHGKEFTLSILSLISNSRYGMSEKELLDITWKNKLYQKEFESRKHKSQPSVDKIPSFIWSKLYFDLESFFMFRSYDGTLLLTFFHRIFLEEAKKYTKNVKEYTHELIFDYFNNKENAPFYFVDDTGSKFINKRKITELPFSLAYIVKNQSKYEENIKNLFLNFHFLYSKVIIGRVYELLGDFQSLGAIKNKAELENIYLIYKAMRQEVTFIQKHPSRLLQSLWNRCWWHDNNKLNSFTKKSESKTNNDKFLYEYLEEWLDSMLLINPNFQWFKSLRPQATSLNGSQLDVYRGHPSPVCFVGFKEDKNIISICNIGEYISWDINSQKTIQNLKIEDTKSFHFKPNSKIKFTNETEVIYEGGGVLADHPGFEFWAWYGISNAKGNKFISGLDDGTVLAIEITDDEIIKKELYKQNAPIRSLKFSKNEKYLVSGAGDGSVTLFSLVSNKIIATVSHEEGWINDVAITNDAKRIFSVGGDGYLYIWVYRNNSYILEQKLLEHKDRIWCISLSNDENLIATGSDDKKVIIWKYNEIQNKFEYYNKHSAHTRWVQAVDFNYNNTLLASSGGDGKIVLWDTENNNISSILTGNDDSIYSLSFSKDDNLLLSGGRDRTVRLWNLDNCKYDIELDEHNERIECASYSKNGLYLATGASDGSIKIRFAENDLLYKQFSCNGRVVTLDFTSNKFGLVYGFNNNIVFKNFIDNKEFLINKENTKEEIECLRISLDDKYVVSAHKNKNNGSLKLWRLSDAKLLDCISDIVNDYFLDLAISHDGLNIVCSSRNGDLYCYHIKNQQFIFNKKKKVFKTWADGVVFSKDSTLVELRGGSWYNRELVTLESKTFDNEISRIPYDGALGAFNEYPLSIDKSEIFVKQKDENLLYYPGTLEFSIMHPNKRQWVGVQRYNHLHLRLEGGQ